MTTELRRWLERHGGADGEVAGAGAAMYGRASLDLLPKASHLGLAPTNLTFGDLITKLAPEPNNVSVHTAVVDALGLIRPAVAGHSLGGIIAALWAAAHPDCPLAANLSGCRPLAGAP
jgi:pimeloyl-ACP methyl ester carboxylesterase